MLSKAVVSDLSVVNAGGAAKGVSDVFGPLSLPLRVLLSAHCVHVMRQRGSGLVWGSAQATAGEPGLQAAWRRGASCRGTYMEEGEEEEKEEKEKEVDGEATW